MKIYYYIFYQLYKFWEIVSIPRFWSDYKAIISICAIEIWLIASVVKFFYIEYFINFSYIYLLPLIIYLVVFNFTLFHKKKACNKYFNEFEKIPKFKNIIGTIIVWLLIITVLIVYFLSSYKLQNR
ncbi:FlaA1/EpsC-like NDP-sugar epimerase [Moheibacter stercoris]|uniref:FlaA1/EpsC-like NDP-sugar epimerase n=1 Tax=Moheibacter stercoris TaxID=1628251 RepID=A0ABV2LS91_9FLAO